LCYFKFFDQRVSEELKDLSLTSHFHQCDAQLIELAEESELRSSVVVSDTPPFLIMLLQNHLGVLW